MSVTTTPAVPPTNDCTSSGCVNHARMPANKAQPKIDRNGGTRTTDSTTSTTSGKRLSRVMLNSLASVACAWVGSNAEAAAGVDRPKIAKSASVMAIAGPDDQIIAATCWLTVTPPTIEGTSTVVSDSGVNLSPQYAPLMTAPAAMTGLAPSSGASATNATPSVAAVVHELPITRPTRPQITTVET